MGRIRTDGEAGGDGHHVDNSGVLSVGSSPAPSKETNVRASRLPVQGSGGGDGLRFFPWTSVVTIAGRLE